MRVKKMANIVVFGKAQSGKSTLLGYLYSQMNKNFNIFEFEQEMKKELGDNYESSYLYAYIMDISKHERIARKGTRNMHVRKIPLDENTRVTIIDTPGVEHHEEPKQRGIFLGDIGIFCLELKDVISDDFMNSSSENATILSTLFLWSNLGHKSIIVALTKCDNCNYSEEDYIIAKENVDHFCNRTKINSVITIPISIIVPQKKGTNIVEKDERFSWYHQETLYEVLTKKITLLKHTKKEELLFSIYNQIDNPSSKAGKVWMIKIIQGKISINDKIRFSPVLTKDKEFVSICANVKTLRYDIHKSEKNEVITTAAAGEIVGIDLKNIYCNNNKIDKKFFDTIYTTCGFSDGVNFLISDVFSFTISIEYEEIFTSNREFNLIWFGRGISFGVYDCAIKDNGLLFVTAKVKNRKLALPIHENGDYYFTKLIIKDRNDKLQDPYYEGTLIKIGEDGNKK